METGSIQQSTSEKLHTGKAGRQARGLYLNLGAGVTYHRLGGLLCMGQGLPVSENVAKCAQHPQPIQRLKGPTCRSTCICGGFEFQCYHRCCVESRVRPSD